MVVSLQRVSVDDAVIDQPFEAGALTLEAGQVAGLSGLPGSGLTRIGLSLLARHAPGGNLAYLDVRGWMNPAAAWEVGIEVDRLVVVRCEDPVTWGRVVAALVSGVRGVYAEVPINVRDPVIRTLAAKARAHRTALVLRPIEGSLPIGLAHLSLIAREIVWSGTDSGHGHLRTRRSRFEVSGKAVGGMQRMIEIEDHGTNDLRVVSRVGTQAARRLA